MTIQSSFGIASLVISGVVAGTLGVAGCAATSDYIYQPDTANATAGGLPATRTPIPGSARASCSSTRTPTTSMVRAA